MVQPGSKGKVLLAYSGGLDTSCILVWLIEQGYDVVAYLANVGQEEDFNAAREKAMKIGAKSFHCDDLRREFVEELIYPAVQANCIYEGIYLLGTSLARPVIARGMMAVAKREGCDFVSHGCTGKGNDQVRFELAFYGLNPEITVIAPWRNPEFYDRFPGRSALLQYAAEKGIPVSQTTSKPWSTDENLFHISYEAGILEDPNTTPPADMWKLTQSPQEAPEKPEDITIEFANGLPVKLHVKETGKTHTDKVDVFVTLNALARNHGIGRIDIVENRFIGLKSRGCYESPGATILRAAHMDLEGLTLDRNVRALRDQFITPQLSNILYNGYFFSPERDFVVSAIPASQKTVNGEVKLKLYKGNVVVCGRKSDEGLYDESAASMDELGGFLPTDTTGFIAIESIRLRQWAKAKAAKGQSALLSALTSASTGTDTGTGTSTKKWPDLSISPQGHHLSRLDDTPFFWQADTAWELAARQNATDVDAYLSNRASKGFNVVQIVAVADLNETTHPNYYGRLPCMTLTPRVPSKTTSATWTGWLSVRLTMVGILVALVPTWGRWVNCGWRGRPIFDVENAGLSLAYGNNYFNETLGAHSINVSMDAVQSRHGVSTSNEAIVGWNSLRNYELIDGMRKTFSGPVINLENHYETGHVPFKPELGVWNSSDVRRRLWNGFFAGSTGVIYGAVSAWQLYDSPWLLDKERLHIARQTSLNYIAF
ncbi:hypothetical protein E3P94_02094 [Wallemia ichthyophaga]|nr:hypothetical protein E3P98_00910 [Wallemia ichthyophaga]TIA99600.1 hypothetical protein E3P95_01970 [Wallemia ichthyophaga]TIB00609.1 hypothetical protein E3P94_02094 [Wallemia ichthyophaga]